MRRYLILVCLVALPLGLLPGGASAQPEVDLACPPSTIPAAGFVDVAAGSVHKADIDCIVWWEITTGTSPTTYEPNGLVTRWQMSLFLMRTFNWWGDDSIDGSDQGFTDIAGLPGATQTAINQLKQLGITTGTSPTTFTPYGTLTRWEMALFLTRLLSSLGVSLPDGSDQGFADIGSLPNATQTAVNQLKQLEITAGTTPTTFSPYDTLTREQMGSFLARTLRIAVESATAGADNLGLQGQWHRDNYGQGQERLFCNVTGSTVKCRFISPNTDSPPQIAIGAFIGSPTTTCPAYLGEWDAFCSGASAVAQGTMTIRTADGTSLVFQETLATDTGGKMLLSWDDPGPQGTEFYCPWFRSYATTLAQSNQCYDKNGVTFP